jgi:hypothetical protein
MLAPKSNSASKLRITGAKKMKTICQFITMRYW